MSIPYKVDLSGISLEGIRDAVDVDPRHIQRKINDITQQLQERVVDGRFVMESVGTFAIVVRASSSIVSQRACTEIILAFEAEKPEGFIDAVMNQGLDEIILTVRFFTEKEKA